MLGLFGEPPRGVGGFLPRRPAHSWYASAVARRTIFLSHTHHGAYTTASSPILSSFYRRTADVSSPESTSFEIFDYLDRSFSRLERTFVSAPPDSEFALKQGVVDCVRRILYRACDSRTVFPQLAPDGDGGLVAVWHAGELMVQINTDDELHSEFIFVRGNEIRTLHVNGEGQEHDPNQQESIGELRRWLLELSQHVNKHNPGWRRLFSDA